jgi:AcrR family transcriptional regulator
MPPTPARILLRECLNSHLRPAQSERRQKQHAYILDAAIRMFAAHGRAGMTMRNIADALDLSRDTLRRQICDLHHLFALVLAAHLTTLTDAIESLDKTAPNLTARRRAELHRITTDQYGYTARLHVLLERERALLPDDERAPIEAQIAHLATLLGATPAEAENALFAAPPIPTPKIQPGQPAATPAWPPPTLTAAPLRPRPHPSPHSMAPHAAAA